MEMKTRCSFCNQWFEVDSYAHLVQCPFCGKETGAMTPKQIRELDESIAKQKRSTTITLIVVLIITALLIWGFVSCVSSCKSAEKERAKEESIYGSQSMACSLVIQSIERRLLNPKRADIDIDYPNIKQDKEKKTFTITGMVEAPNAFGAMLLKPFSATVQYDGYGYKLINLNLE